MATVHHKITGCVVKTIHLSREEAFVALCRAFDLDPTKTTWKAQGLVKIDLTEVIETETTSQVEVDKPNTKSD